MRVAALAVALSLACTCAKAEGPISCMFKGPDSIPTDAAGRETAGVFGEADPLVFSFSSSPASVMFIRPEHRAALSDVARIVVEADRLYFNVRNPVMKGLETQKFTLLTVFVNRFQGTAMIMLSVPSGFNLWVRSGDCVTQKF